MRLYGIDSSGDVTIALIMQLSHEVSELSPAPPFRSPSAGRPTSHTLTPNPVFLLERYPDIVQRK